MLVAGIEESRLIDDSTCGRCWFSIKTDTITKRRTVPNPKVEKTEVEFATELSYQ